LNPIIEACIRAQRFEKVGELLPEEPLPPSTLLTLVKSYSKIGRLDQALSYMGQTEGNYISDTQTLNALIECCIKNDRFEKAEELFKAHLESSADLITFSCMIKGFCKFAMVERAFDALQRMQARGIKPDEVLFNSLLDGCSKAGKVDDAFKLYS